MSRNGGADEPKKVVVLPGKKKKNLISIAPPDSFASPTAASFFSSFVSPSASISPAPPRSFVPPTPLASSSSSTSTCTVAVASSSASSIPAARRAKVPHESLMVGYKREFAVRTIGMLSSRLTLQLNFETHLVKILRGESSDDSALREQFEISSVVYLDKHSKTPPVVSIVAHVHPAALRFACKTIKESFCFDTPYEKDEFCRLLHVSIMLGHSGFKAFQRLADSRCLLDAYELSFPLFRMIVGDEASESKENRSETLYDYCEYLVLLGEAFQSLTEKHALMPVAISDALGHPTLHLLPGEEAITRMNLAYLDPCGAFRVLGITRGVFYLTTHRVAVQVYNLALRPKFDFVAPLAHIDRALVNYVSNSLRLTLLDNRVLEIGFDSPSTWIQTAADKINRFIATLRRDPRKSFLMKASKGLSAASAASSSSTPSTSSSSLSSSSSLEPVVQEGWNLYVPMTEFTRLGLTSRGWRVVNAISFEDENGAHVFAVPEMVADQQLRQIKAYRDGQRLPAVVWRHPRTTAVLVRGAQPSLSATRTDNDEGLLVSIRVLNPNTDTLFIAAMGKRAEEYAKCIKICKNSDDVVSLRLSYEKLTQLCADRANLFTSTAPSPHIESSLSHDTDEAGASLVFNVMQKVGAVEDNRQTSWNTALDQTRWLEHVKALLRDATLVAAMLDTRGASVFVHGTTGVDRESAVVGLAELLLDPFYRSIKGFLILIEKEWLNAGHPFPKRTGLGETTPEERSPIFVLWMDAVWQLTVQFPAVFEFTEDLLVFVLEATQTDYFGTFMNNNEDSRIYSFLKGTLSAWTPLLVNQSLYTNPFYSHYIEVKENAMLSSSEGGIGEKEKEVEEDMLFTNLLRRSSNPPPAASSLRRASSGFLSGITNTVSLHTSAPSDSTLPSSSSQTPSSSSAAAASSNTSASNTSSSSTSSSSMLYPNISSYSILFWDRYFFRWQHNTSPSAQLVELQRKWGKVAEAKWLEVDRSRRSDFEKEKAERESILAHENREREAKFKADEARRKEELESTMAVEQEKFRKAQELASFTRIQNEQLKFLEQARTRELDIAKEEAARQDRIRKEDAARKATMDKEYKEFLEYQEMMKKKEEAEKKAREERAREEELKQAELLRLEELKIENAKTENSTSMKRSDSQIEPPQARSPRHRFWVTIPSFASISETEGGKTHTNFQVIVREFYEKTNYLEWTVEKRYSDFEALHDKLKAEFTKLPVPAMPPKQGMLKSSKSEAFLHSRRLALEAFLQKLVTSPIFQVDSLHTFLQIGSPDRQIVMGSEPLQ